MYINAVLSYLGAWEKLRTAYPIEFGDMHEVISRLDAPKQRYSRELAMGGKLVYSASDLNKLIAKGFKHTGWEIDSRLFLSRTSKQRISRIDFIRNNVGVEVNLGKFAFVESDLFVKFPMFLKAGRIQLGCILMPMESLARSMSIGTSDFEMIRDRITELYPLPLKYSFAIIGFSEQPSSLHVTEMTSEIDRYLIDTIGYTLFEMKLLTERPNYDFKKELPDNKKFAKNACAFANTKGGGLFLLGVDNNGDVTGLPRVELDKTQQWCGQIIHTTCSPKPEFEFKVFDLADDPTKCVVVLRIFEILHKPCMAFEKVYVRAGSPDGQAAKPEEIRRLVLGSD